MLDVPQTHFFLMWQGIPLKGLTSFCHTSLPLLSGLHSWCFSIHLISQYPSWLLRFTCPYWKGFCACWRRYPWCLYDCFLQGEFEENHPTWITYNVVLAALRNNIGGYRCCEWVIQFVVELVVVLCLPYVCIEVGLYICLYLACAQISVV